MEASRTAIRLEQALDLRAAALLRDEAHQALAQGNDLEVDASAVQRVGLACLQILLSARRSFAAQGVGFTLTAPSEAMVDACRMAGMDELLEQNVQGSKLC